MCKSKTTLPVTRSLWPKPCLHVSSSYWGIYWKAKLTMITWHQFLDSCKGHLPTVIRMCIVLWSTWGLGPWTRSCLRHWLQPWWVWSLWAPSASSPQQSDLPQVCCTPPSWPLDPDNKGCIWPTSPGTHCEHGMQRFTDDWGQCVGQTKWTDCDC